MLVDDNEMDVELTLNAFSQSAVASRIIVARDGEEALSWISRWEAGEPTPSFILLDINMPKVNGLEVVSKLKMHPTLRTIPVIMLTSSANITDVQNAYLNGANSYIVKPVDFDRFRAFAAEISRYWLNLNLGHA